MRLMRVKKKMPVARRRTTGTNSLREKKLEYHTCNTNNTFSDETFLFVLLLIANTPITFF